MILALWNKRRPLNRTDGARWGDDEKPAHQAKTGQSAHELRDYEHRNIGRRDPGKAVGQSTSDRNGGIGEGRGGGKPVGRRDVEADSDRNRLTFEARHRENGDDQTEGGNEFRKPLRRAGACFSVSSNNGSSNMPCATSVPRHPRTICAPA